MEITKKDSFTGVFSGLFSDAIEKAFERLLLVAVLFDFRVCKKPIATLEAMAFSRKNLK